MAPRGRSRRAWISSSVSAVETSLKAQGSLVARYKSCPTQSVSLLGTKQSQEFAVISLRIWTRLLDKREFLLSFLLLFSLLMLMVRSRQLGMGDFPTSDM